MPQYLSNPLTDSDGTTHKLQIPFVSRALSRLRETFPGSCYFASRHHWDEIGIFEGDRDDSRAGGTLADELLAAPETTVIL